MRVFLFFVALVCAGCDDGQLSAPHQADDSFEPTCDIVVNATLPAHGASDAYHRGDIEFYLSEPAPEATVVADVEGITTFRDDGRTVVFTPLAPLPPRSRHTMGLDYCGGQPRIEFSTSALGAPLEVPLSDIIGRTYAVDVTQGRFIAGEGIAELAASVFTREILLSVVDIHDDDTIDMRLALAMPDDTVQDTCSQTLELPPANISHAPFMDFSASDVSFKAEGSSIHLENVELSGTLSPDGSFLGGGQFTATLNAADIVDAWDLSNVDTLCMLSDNIGVPCEACPDGSDDTCITIQATHIGAPEVEGLFVEPIAVPDSHADCLLDE